MAPHSSYMEPALNSCLSFGGGFPQQPDLPGSKTESNKYSETEKRDSDDSIPIETRAATGILTEESDGAGTGVEGAAGAAGQVELKVQKVLEPEGVAVDEIGEHVRVVEKEGRACGRAKGDGDTRTSYGGGGAGPGEKIGEGADDPKDSPGGDASIGGGGDGADCKSFSADTVKYDLPPSANPDGEDGGPSTGMAREDGPGEEDAPTSPGEVRGSSPPPLPSPDGEPPLSSGAVLSPSPSPLSVGAVAGDTPRTDQDSRFGSAVSSFRSPSSGKYIRPHTAPSPFSSPHNAPSSTTKKKLQFDASIDYDSSGNLLHPVSSEPNLKTDYSPVEITESEKSLCNVLMTPNKPRREKIRTMAQESGSDVATTERMRRNSDSILEDVVIAEQLRRRLNVRWQQITKRTITNTDLSDFIMESIMKNSLDAISAAKPTSGRLSNAADIAAKVLMEGYFTNMPDRESRQRARDLFLESLHRETFREGGLLCRQNSAGDKIFVIEEGVVQFCVDGQVAGNAKAGSVVGELSLVYGVPHTADIVAATDCVVWTMDALSFRRIQAISARQHLKESKISVYRKLQRTASTLLDEQELEEKQHTDWKLSKGQFESLKKHKIIGRGTFGSVYLAIASATDERKKKCYGLKEMSKKSIVDRNNQKRVLIEMNALLAVKSCPFTISLEGAYQDKRSVYFLNEFVQGGNLISYMIEKDKLSHSECVFFTANLVSALIHVHKMGFIHRDVKPENCLIGRDGYLKLCDFGMAKRLPAIVNIPNGGTEVVLYAFTMCGTPEFMAPEFVLSTGYGKGVDWWAVGCIVTEMYCGHGPFDFDGDLKRTFQEVCQVGVKKKRFVPPPKLEDAGGAPAEAFVQALLTAASDRIGNKDDSEVPRHQYFSGMDFNKLNDKTIPAPYLPILSGGADTSHFPLQVEESGEIEEHDGRSSWCDGFLWTGPD